MRRKNARKGFTIVELVIVIAVIAILATTLVPTFGNVIQNAQETAAKQEAKNAYTSYMVANAGKGEMPELFLYKAEEGRVVAIRNGAAVGIYATPEEALTALIGEDYDMNELQPTADGKFFAYGGEVPTASNPTEPPIQPEEPPVELTDWSGASAVFVGDSITYASGIANPYHKLVEAELGLLNSPHMGIAGSCISATSNYNHTYTPLIDRYQNIPAVELIVIFMGTNDFGHNTPLGTDQDTTDISFYGALNMIIPGVKAAHPNSQIVVMTPLHRGAFNVQPVDSAQNGAGCTLADYVGAIKDVCADNEIPVIDLFNLCALNPTDKIYFSDNLHPTAKGHEELAKIIAEELKKIPRKEGNGEPVEPEIPDEPDVEEPNYTLVRGNRFADMSNTNRACTVNNIYLEAGTIIMLKDEAKYDWAVAKEDDSTATTGTDYYFYNGWDSAAYRIVTEDGYYGFVLKKNNDAVFDFESEDSSDLRDYFEIVDTLKMVQGNRMTAGSEANRQSSAFNLYLRKGTVIKFNGANGADAWALSKVLGNTSAIKAEYVTGGWTSTATYVVAEDGYYGFVVKFNADTPVSDEYTLLDYFTISSFEISKMVQGNRMVSNVASEDGKIPMRITSAYNLYLTAGTKITFNPGNGASHWTLSIKLDAADTIGGGNYLLDPLWSQSTSYTVQEDGYYAFVIKDNDEEINAEDYNLFDIFTIDGYNK